MAPMEPMVTPRRRSRSEVEPDDEDAVVDFSSGRSKRARNGNHDHTNEDVETPSHGLQKEVLEPRGSRGAYQPGAIIRVKLKNFVTYTAVEFFPGPNLNMVIGPNGTGKSTLVCAICIGLGWGPQYLGRAKEVSEFVKHGCQEASIEIELSKDPRRFKRNVIIRCVIKKDGNKTIYSVNGENKSKKATVELARSLSIQIDNLCQFLPQDKVVEFAAMTPVELLKSTERAVADQGMIDTHEYLKDRRKSQKDLQNQIDTDQNVLNNLEGRQRLQEADVERMREREGLVQHVEWLEMGRPFAAYRAARKVHTAARERMKIAAQELEELKAEVEPSLKSIKEKDRYRKQCVAAGDYRKKVVSKSEEHADKDQKKYSNLAEQEQETDTQVNAEKKATQKHKNEIARLEGNIRRLEKQIAEPSPEADISSYNERIREIQRTMQEHEGRIRELQDNQREMDREGFERQAKIRQAESNLEQLDSQAGRQTHKLQQLSRDTYQGWLWIQENQDEFEKPIFGPPLVECSVNDPRYADLIEALFQRNVSLSFTVQTKNDFAKLSSILSDRLRLSEINIKTITVDFDYFKSPISNEDMRQLGLEGWAIDHLVGPAPVLAMLCAEIKLHETGVSLRDTTPRQFETLQNSSISTWVTGKSSYRITRRREYGAGATSTQVREVRPARLWTDQPVDLSAKTDMQDSIQGWRAEFADIRNKFQDLKVQVEAHRAAVRSGQDDVAELIREKSAKQKAIGEFKALPTKLAQEQDKLDTAQEALDSIKQRIKELLTSKETLAMDCARAAISHVETVEALRIAHNAVYEAEIMTIEATSDLATLTERNSAVVDMIEEREKEVADLRNKTQQMRDSTKVMIDKCQEVLSEVQSNPELEAFLRGLPEEQTPEDLESEISSEKARLELMQEGNGGVIREYEQRRRKIDTTRSKLNEYLEAKAELDGVIVSLHDEWEPKLDNLIKQISDAFSFNMQQINCAGEVGISKDEDFDQWAIQIRVKFRESEPMSVLDSHRQSGGERAVSTIFYLMSLQSLTRSPFRIVDEINQGMDPRNERLVHKRMVAIACGNSTSAGLSGSPTASNTADSGYGSMARHVNGNADSGGSLHDPTTDDGPSHTSSSALGNGSQYFLITPKLLHDLEYARGMRVLCIASGQYMPDDQSRVDFGKALTLARQLKAERDSGRVNGFSTGGISGGMHGMNGVEQGRTGLAAG